LTVRKCLSILATRS